LEDLLRPIVDAGLRKGASFCEARFFEGRSNSISIENGIAKGLSSGIVRGVGVRVIVEGRWGFASTNVLTRDSLEGGLDDALGAARSIAHSAGEAAVVAEQRPTVDTVVHKAKRSPEDVGIEEKVSRAVEIEREAGTYSDRVKDTFVNYYDGLTTVAVCNSFGTCIEETAPRAFMSCRVISREGNNMQVGYESVGAVTGYEIIDSIQPGEFSARAAQKAVRLLSAKAPPGGTLTAVLDQRVGALFVHEAFGHNCEGDSVFGGQSIVSDKMGKNVASDLVTIVDDPTLTGNGYFAYDHEGTRAEPHMIVEHGILTGFLHSLESAARLGSTPHGSARAQSHQFLPIVRMSNTCIANGDMNLGEILEDVELGIYLSGSMYGYVETQKGQFTCKVEEGWLIDRGELTDHLRDVAISGLTLDALRNITAVGKDFKIDAPGMCGKNAQSVAVDGGSPHVRIEGIVVGGRQ